ncbi:MAG: hypothetical protein MRECE_12c015 [Mycoplasmataceae bacterium CE_OT135]|nr:MAG: hypothetical protein MRECE_12c015 [Mycoplasmataceae bacterium CE_OT135]
MVDAQKWLDRNYLKRGRNKIIELDIKQKNLQGFLSLESFANLERLYCSYNQLTNLDLNNCDNLKELNCSGNQLTDLNFLNNLKNPEKLTKLSIRDNNIFSDLSPLSRFANLERLCLDNNRPFTGLGKLKGLIVSNTNIDSGLEYLPGSIEYFYCSADVKQGAKVKAIEKFLKKIKGEDFSQKLKEIKQKMKQWRKLNFAEEEIRQWINAGATLDDYKFVAWLRDVKNYEPEWITNYQDDYQTLSDRFKKYGLCPECNQPNTGEQWCKDCNKSHLLAQQASNNLQINEFIQKYQLQATDADKFIEWIPYEQFAEVEYLAEGGFGRVYKAKWTAGNIHHWDTKDNQWCRENDYYYEDKDKYKLNKKYRDYRMVALKSLTNSQENTDFLEETANHKIIDDWFNNIVPCYGLSQDPATKNYLMVMQYLPEGNLRQYLGNKNRELTLQAKLSQLLHLAQGLKDLHQKKLIHRDFHSGNILKGIEQTSCLITDLGLCKPANETGKEDKIFGVMPYIAPEVLQSQPYTQASDIYSFGMVAYELLTGLPPYYDREHSLSLGIDICQGLRPKFNIKIPPLLEGLIKRCWDADPKKRPTANELEKTLRDWEQGNTEFAQQLQATEENNKTLPDSIRFLNYQKKMHTGAVYHSKLLPTKEITQLMQNFNFQTKTLELNEQLTKAKELAKEITMKQKYNDFKEALKFVLEKSEELETIITTSQLVISEEMKEELTKIKELKHKSQEKDSIYQELARKKSAKEQELADLKKTIIANNKITGEDDLGEIKEMLKAQIEFIKNNDLERLNLSKKRLVKMKIINEAEINSLCQLQTEITNLELELNNNIDQSTRQLTQIINNIGNINVTQGNVLVGNNFGDGANIDSNYAKSIEETEQQAQILQPTNQPYGTPSSFKNN